jgi:hypothetical protein
MSAEVVDLMSREVLVVAALEAETSVQRRKELERQRVELQVQRQQIYERKHP